MKTKCFFCLFFKNMWSDIKVKFKDEFNKPLNLEIPIFAISFLSLVFVLEWLWVNYYEIIKLILIYSCLGLVAIVSLIMIGINVYQLCVWLRKLYLKSKEECK